MNSDELKKYIINNNLIKNILESIGCHSFINGKDLRAALPNEDDNTKISLNTETLFIRIFTKGESIKGSIFDLIMYIDNCTFSEAYNKCCNLIGIDNHFDIKKKKSNPLDFYKKIKIFKTYIPNQTYYDLSILNRFSKIPHIDLIHNDGIISQEHINKYYIMFDERTDRIIFPHFKYNDNNLIAGIIGRTINKAYKELKIPKYLNLLDTDYEKKYNLYGLSHNLKYIKKYNIVIVFEAEKSVIKADMFKYPIGVSVGCHEISEFQMQLLISLNVEIVIAFDKDVEDTHILNECKKIYPYRKVSYIKDKYNLLNEKDSPVDRGYKKWEYLFKNKIIYKA